jgi:hypothetical protein
MPGFNNFDFRLSRKVPVYEQTYLEFSADAFNLLNHQIITGVNGTYSQYATVAAPTTQTPSPPCNLNTQTAGTTAAPLQGCISPYTGTGLSAFGVTSGTNNSLYQARQLQVAAKFYF